MGWWMVIFVTCFALLKVCSSFQFNGAYVSVVRKTIKSGSIVSITPGIQDQKSRFTVNNIQQNNAISNILFFPSYLETYTKPSDPVNDVLNDDHIASLLCDKGYVVHAIIPKNVDSMLQVQKDAILWLLSGTDSSSGGSDVTLKNIALVGCELSCLSILSLLSEKLHPLYPRPVDIGGVVLIDCPPVHATLSLDGRQTILFRYLEPLLSVPQEIIQKCISEKNSIISSQPRERKRKCKSWKQKLKQKLMENRLCMDLHTRQEGPYQRLINYYLSKGFDRDNLFELLNNARVLRDCNSCSPCSQLQILDGFPYPTNENRLFRTMEEESVYESLVFSFDMKRRLNKLQRKPDIYKSIGEVDEEITLENIFQSHNQTMTKWLSTSSDDLTSKFIPRSPPNLSEFGSQMQNKFLIIATNEMRKKDKYSRSEDPRDGWGVEAIEELADILKSDPVVHCDSGNDDDQHGNALTGTDVHCTLAEDDRTYRRNVNLANLISNWLCAIPAISENVYYT